MWDGESPVCKDPAQPGQARMHDDHCAVSAAKLPVEVKGIGWGKERADGRPDCLFNFLYIAPGGP